VAVTRREAVVFLLIAAGLIAAGLVWLLGPWGLIGSGVGFGAVVLFVFDIREEKRADSVAVPARPDLLSR
jgi:asparagine N-glycosylation enzyme membrane subunit Stt3